MRELLRRVAFQAQLLSLMHLYRPVTRVEEFAA